MEFLIEKEIYTSDHLKNIVGMKWMYYNISTNHDIYRLGDMRLRFERMPEGLKYLGILCRNINEKEM